jgi:hypothetical protein
VRRLWPFAVLAMFLLGACGGTDRPEGVVERWLISLNQGKAGEPEKFAPAALSERILPHWETRDPGDLDVIEVGKGRRGDLAFGTFSTETWRVPFRVERASGVSIAGTAVTQKLRVGWRVTTLRVGDHSLLVPSEGGARIGSASAGTWAIAVAISAILMLLVAFVIRLTPKPMTLPTSKS